MKVEFLKQFSRDLDKVASKALKAKVVDLILALESADNLQSIPNAKKLKGHRNAYRIRMGDYRLGLFVDNETIVLARILHRKDIYKIFP